jgi:hypothetical protein
MRAESVEFSRKFTENAGGALFGINPERLYYGKANSLGAGLVANLLKNVPKRSEFSGDGTVFAFSLSLIILIFIFFSFPVFFRQFLLFLFFPLDISPG